ncbi:MAG: citrate synthase [Alphaproteobacteria bacterium]|nr:MAG: citrate synthase [Alphaproteobacteria bacterium]
MKWLTAQAAAARLGVKPQTLYAYVSRGRITARPADDDPRQSLYSAADVATLERRRRGGRGRKTVAAGAISWGDPVLESAITAVRDGRLIYRGVDAVTFASTATIEDAARLLIGYAPDARRRSPGAAGGESAKARGFAFLAARAASDPPSLGRRPEQLAAESLDLIAGLGVAFAGADLADAHLHENPSTFAARVAASTGAPVAAAALAGYATLSGPLHGEASARAVLFLETALRDGAQAAVNATLARAEPLPAIGHALYPMGDPRAASLLKALAPSTPLQEAIDGAEAASGDHANIDMALAALTLDLDLPRDAPFVIFAGGRMAGWCAHAIEQRETGRVIRPRASYTGD